MEKKRRRVWWETLNNSQMKLSPRIIQSPFMKTKSSSPKFMIFSTTSPILQSRKQAMTLRTKTE
jgi:hypothetical protein